MSKFTPVLIGLVLAIALPVLAAGLNGCLLPSRARVRVVPVASARWDEPAPPAPPVVEDAIELPAVLIRPARASARKTPPRPQACYLHTLVQGGNPDHPFVLVCG